MDATKSPGRRKRKVPAVAARSSRKVVVDFPDALFRETELAIKELSTSRSNFVRLAVEEFLRGRRQKLLQEQLIDGYTANANVARGIAEELSQFD